MPALTLTQTIKILLLFILIGTIVILGKPFLIPFIIALVLATLLLPLAVYFEKKGFNRIMSSLCSVLIFILFGAGILFFISLKLTSFLTDLTVIKDHFNSNLKISQEFIVQHFGITIDNQKKMLFSGLPDLKFLVQNIISSLSSIIGQVILIMGHTFFIIYSRKRLKTFLLKTLKKESNSHTESILNNAVHISQQYLLGLFKMIICLWLMYGIGFSILGIPNAFFFAILCGLLEVIPYIGNITGTSLTVIAAALSGVSMGTLGGIVVVYGIIQFIQGWFLEPIIVGSQVKINSYATIIALLLGEIIWGISGLVLAIPLTAILKIICDNVDSLKPIGYLLGEDE